MSFINQLNNIVYEFKEIGGECIYKINGKDLCEMTKEEISKSIISLIENSDLVNIKHALAILIRYNKHVVINHIKENEYFGNVFRLIEE